MVGGRGAGQHGREQGDGGKQHAAQPEGSHASTVDLWVGGRQTD